MYRTFVILRHTFREAMVQPIYSLLTGIGAAVLLIFAFLPFFTLGEDTVMYKSVALDVILALVLIATLFATSRSIFDEIEDRTMLTLMSKPLAKWEVLLGKYLGIVLAAAIAVALLGAITALGIWWRIPGDYMLSTRTVDDRELTQLAGYRWMHLSGLLPALVLQWLQVAVLAAVGVALSTRVPLVVNLVIVIFLYLAGNLLRFLFPLGDQSPLTSGLAWLISILLPYLENFDLKQFTVHRPIRMAQFASDPRAVGLGTVWGYVALAAGYAAAYILLCLSAGLWLFQGRELGGSEG